MKLSEMTIDGAIATAMLEVPECFPQDDRDEAPPTGQACYRALWFHAAAVWLANHPNSFRRRIGFGRQRDQWVVRTFEIENPGFDQPWPQPTEYHALAAACLLAAGKEVP
jgi:hypothetical protein